MVIVHLSGGFGNQLFSYAFGYAMAKKRNDKFAIDTAIQDAPWFFRNPDILNLDIRYDTHITYKIGRSIVERALLNKIIFRNKIGWNTRVIKEAGQEKIFLDGYYDICRPYEMVYFKGNWVSEKYFKDVTNEIRDMFVFKAPLSEGAATVCKEIEQCKNSVTIHCRRGDYKRLKACITADYFCTAMQYMSEHLDNPVFYCFSEEQDWAKKQFRGLPYDIRYPEYQSAEKGIEDFRLLQAGKHQIISNSTYSWWAAYLNDNPKKIIVTPQGGICDEEFCLKEWIKFPYETE